MVTLEKNTDQIGAFTERRIFDYGNAPAYRDTLQAGTIKECLLLYSGDAIADYGIGQTGTIAEHRLPDPRDAAGDGDTR